MARMCDFLSVGGVIGIMRHDLYRHAAEHHNLTLYFCLENYVVVWSSAKYIFIFAKFKRWKVSKNSVFKNSAVIP